MKLIRSSRHFYQKNNKVKTQAIHNFLNEYRTAVQFYIDFIWDNPLSWQTAKGEARTLDIKNLILDCPSVYDYQICQFQTNLANRSLSSAITQALSIVKSKTNDVRKRQFALLKANENGKNTNKLQEKLNKAIKNLKKPNLGYYFKAELSSKNIVLERNKNSKHFEYWLKFQGLGTDKPFVIPVVLHKQDHKLINRDFKTKGSFLIGRDSFEIRYGKEVEKRTDGEIIGCDTGIKTVTTFSHSKNEIDRVNGLTYDDAVKICARKQKGSKNFKQSLITRDNIIKAIINRVNFENVKQINLENNSSLKYKQRTSRYLRYHAYGVIKEKLEQVASELGVQVQMQTSHYKSQRCSSCGWTQKSNRKGNLFLCKRCEYTADADYNASENNRLKLSWLDFGPINKQRLNISGFEWLIEAGEEFGVPHLVGSDKS